MTTRPEERELATIEPTPLLAKAGDSRGLGGLLVLLEGAERPLPLRRVTVQAAILADCCRTTIEQHFTNPYDVAPEAPDSAERGEAPEAIERDMAAQLVDLCQAGEEGEALKEIIGALDA